MNHFALRHAIRPSSIFKHALRRPKISALLLAAWLPPQSTMNEALSHLRMRGLLPMMESQEPYPVLLWSVHLHRP